MAFAGEVAWITGASSGIGAAMARALAADGAHVILSGRNADALNEVAADCAKGNATALVLPFEVTDHPAGLAAAEQAWAWAAERSGGIDILFNNAGISQRSLAVDTDYAVYEQIIAVDLLAPIALTQALLGRMVARGKGRIAMVSSVAGKVGVPLRTAYSAAKFGLIGYANALRSEVTGAGLEVHVIAPGSVRTNVSRNALNADGSRRGVSDKGIDGGMDPEVAVAQMLAEMAEGKREIIVATGFEQMIGEACRTPDAIFDRMAKMVADGYATKMESPKAETTE
ncbi:SDR family NAD(P)-dependent oxidoreductase [Novosphingobium sp.]|uniref:SDR family NAD(P)-dependent oxidoreductase n=1 Tax=Novosphingobium sp. TaxID=1874826 RepID=UPI001D6E344B|nr:SDR family NAD(P)-dependent oxidoreductase [Novosphingobium sp.]MBX9664627.1 SDR family NAD(P)-dependent oxidoreductase [Novosphingobium sp.]